MNNGKYEFIGLLLGIASWVIGAFISYIMVEPHDFLGTLIFLAVFLVIGKIVDALFVYAILALSKKH